MNKAGNAIVIGMANVKTPRPVVYITFFSGTDVNCCITSTVKNDKKSSFHYCITASFERSLRS